MLRGDLDEQWLKIFSILILPGDHRRAILKYSEHARLRAARVGLARPVYRASNC
jgi:hypothetical protein